MSDLVAVRLDDGVATLTLDDTKANALSPTLSAAIEAALDQAGEARLVVLRGRPGVFCGGFDLRIIRGGDAVDRSAMTEAGYRLMQRLYLLPQPLLIACTGHAVAAGALLLLTADTRIGLAGSFRIGLNETAIGLALPGIGLELARDRLLPSALTEATLGARLYDPEGAARVGYLDQVATPERFEADVAAASEALLKLDGSAYAETKWRLRGGFQGRVAG